MLLNNLDISYSNIKLVHAPDLKISLFHFISPANHRVSQLSL